MGIQGIQGSFNQTQPIVKEIKEFRDQWIKQMLIDLIYNPEESAKIKKFLSK
jgi:hypothetical protein